MPLKRAPLTAGDIIDWAVAELLDISSSCEALGPQGVNYAARLTKNRRTLFVKSFIFDNRISRDIPTRIKIGKFKKSVQPSQRIELIYKKLAQLYSEHIVRDGNPPYTGSMAYLLGRFITTTPPPNPEVIGALDAYAVFLAHKNAKEKSKSFSTSSKEILKERLERIATACRGISSAAKAAGLRCNFAITARAVKLKAEWPNGASTEINIRPSSKSNSADGIFDCIFTIAGNDASIKPTTVPLSSLGTHVSKTILQRSSVKRRLPSSPPTKSIQRGKSKSTPRHKHGQKTLHSTAMTSNPSKNIKRHQPTDTDQRGANGIAGASSKSIVTLDGSFAEVRAKCPNCKKQFRVTLTRAESSTYCLYFEKRVPHNVRLGPI